MKIAMVSYYLPPFDRIGAGYQMHYLANEYTKHGHSVKMFSQYATKGEDALYDVVHVPVGNTNRIFRYAWNIRKQDFSGFDLLHTAGEDYLLGGIKRPYHIRTFMGSCFAEALNSQGFRDTLRMSLLGICEWAACAVADRKVCISQNTTRYIPWAKDVIGCGMDSDVFKPGTMKSGVPTILFVGILDSRKRGRLLLEAFQKEIKPSIPEAELWIVRDNTQINIDGVRSFGYVSLATLVELYQTAWAFCLPSSYEGFGVPYIEAMASGTPVVATPNPGAYEVLEGGKHGIITDPADLGTTLIDLLQNQETRERYRTAGLERAKSFTWGNIVGQYERFYNEAMGQRRNKYMRRISTP